METRVLVTGGAGFLGSHLCDRLLSQGAAVIALDNLYTGSEDNLRHLDGHPRFRFLRADVKAPSAVEGLEVDAIFHMACPASPVHYQRDPVETIKTCVQGTLNMLELAERTGARLLIASTSEVYGDPEAHAHPQVEAYWGHVNPIGPRSCYDEGKRCGEALAVSYARSRAVELRIARIFNTYGPRMQVDDGRVVSNFVVQALRGEPLTVHGDGQQTRSFCYVDDLVEGLLRLHAAPDLQARPVNLGNPDEFTILELAELVAAKIGSGTAVTWQDRPEDDPRQRKPDITLAKTLLGWSPTVNLSEGLDHTIRYFRENLKR